MSEYRVAMLGLELGERLECHAWHFAPFMDECDPLVLREMQAYIYVWFTDGGHFDEITKVHPTPGFRITKVWDIQNLQRTRDLARLLYNRATVCERVEQTWDDVDAAFIADGGGDGSLHLEYARPFLERGIPVFVDKPFACDYADAKAMVDLADQTGTPLFSASILSHVYEVDYFKSRWQEIPPPGFGVVKGLGPHLGAIIHGLGLAQGIFGTGVDWVECMGSPPPEVLSLRRDDLIEAGPLEPGDYPLEVMMLHYPDTRQVIVCNTAVDRYDWFSCEVWGMAQRRNPPPRMYLRSLDIGDAEFLGGSVKIVELFLQMLQTGKPPVPYEVPLELIAIVEAARLAQRERRRVYIEEIMGERP